MDTAASMPVHMYSVSSLLGSGARLSGPKIDATLILVVQQNLDNSRFNQHLAANIGHHKIDILLHLYMLLRSRSDGDNTTPPCQCT